MKRYVMALLIGVALPICAMDDDRDGLNPFKGCGFGFDAKSLKLAMNTVGQFELKKKFTDLLEYLEIEDQQKKEDELEQTPQPPKEEQEKKKEEGSSDIEALRKLMLEQQDEIKKLQKELKKKQETEDKKYAKWLEQQDQQQ